MTDMVSSRLNPRYTSRMIGWFDDDPTAPEVPTEIAEDPAMGVLLHARTAMVAGANIDQDLSQWVLTLTANPDGSWNGWLADAVLRVRILTALGVGYGALPVDAETGRCYPRTYSDRMVLDRAIDWLHTELLADPR
jgi:hypothetical protein